MYIVYEVYEVSLWTAQLGQVSGSIIVSLFRCPTGCLAVNQPFDLSEGNRTMEPWNDRLQITSAVN